MRGTESANCRQSDGEDSESSPLKNSDTADRVFAKLLPIPKNSVGAAYVLHYFGSLAQDGEAVFLRNYGSALWST